MIALALFTAVMLAMPSGAISTSTDGVPKTPTSFSNTSTENPPKTCPAACKCVHTPESKDYKCTIDDIYFTVSVGTNADTTIIVTCENGTLPSYVVLPELAAAKARAISTLAVRGCLLRNESLALTFRALAGSTSETPHRLVLFGTPPGTLTATHLRGLLLKTLTLRAPNGAGARTPLVDLPMTALAALPELQGLTIAGWRVRLPPDGFAAIPLLTSLELSGGQLPELPADAFNHLSKLQFLGLWQNGLQLVSPGALRGLSALDKLELSRNMLHSLSVGGLEGAQKLHKLYLVGGAPSKLENSLLDDVPELQVLELLGSNSLVLGSQALAGRGALRDVRIEHCGLKELPAEVLVGSTALRRLRLANNSLRTVPPGVLRDQGQLEQLDLCRNFLEHLPNRAFEGLSNLLSLNLSHNRLQTLTASTFSPLSRLQYLELTHNSLTFASSVRFEVPPPLADMDFGKRSPLDCLSELRNLNLAHNNVSVIYYDWRFLLLKLTQLDLSYNKFTELADADLNFVQTDITVDLRHNAIASVSLMDSGDPLPNHVVEEQKARISLDDNPFDCDCRLYGLTRRLRGARAFGTEPRLDVGSARCVAPPALTATKLSTLRPRNLTCNLSRDDLPPSCSIGLARPATTALELTCTAPPSSDWLLKSNGYELELTMITVPPPDAVWPPTRRLNLAGLGLSELPARLPPGLRELDLTNNRLTVVPPTLWNVTPAALQLGGNALACTCGHGAALAELRQHADRVLDFNMLRCADGRAPNDVDPKELCIVWVWAGGALTVTLALITLLVMFRRHFSCGRLHKKHEPAGPFDYDAFVWFAAKDHWLVMDRVTDGLRRRGARVLVAHESWAAGAWVPLEVRRSVRAARRSVLVVSDAWADCLWSRTVYRAACEHEVSGGARPVLVARGSRNLAMDTRLDEDLRARLAAGSCVEWEWGEVRFWRELCNRVPFVRDELKKAPIEGQII